MDVFKKIACLMLVPGQLRRLYKLTKRSQGFEFAFAESYDNVTGEKIVDRHRITGVHRFLGRGEGFLGLVESSFDHSIWQVLQLDGLNKKISKGFAHFMVYLQQTEDAPHIPSAPGRAFKDG